MFDKKYDAEELASIYKSVYEKKLDPVGQEDKDIDNDGDHDKSDKYLLNRRKVRSDAIKSGMHRDAKTGEVVDKAEVGKTYYPNFPKKKTSVALRKEKESMKKEQVEEGKASMGADVTDALPWNRNTKYTTQGKLRKPGENVHGKQTGKGLNTTTATMGAKPAPRPLANPGPMKDSSNAELGGSRSHPGAPGGSKGFGWNKLKKEEVELDENRRAARSAGGYKDDSKKQPDPSKDGFTGIGNMSIDAIRKMSARIEKEKTKKEEVEVVDEGSMKKARENVGASTCWDGYKAKGTKKKNGREVPNCVKEEEELEEDKKELSREKRNKMFRRAGNLSREALQGGDKGSEAHKKSGKIVKALNKDAEENNRNDVREETLRDIYEGKKKGLWDNIHAKRKRGEKPAKPGDEDYPKTLKIESNEKLEEAAPALVGVLAKMAAKKAAVHVAKKGAEKVKDKMGKLLKGDEEEEG